MPVIKSRRMGWAGDVGHMGRVETYTGFWWENLRENPGVDGRFILRWALRKRDVGAIDWTVLAEDREVTSTCECGNEPSGSIKCGKLVE
jgi:hypothetical protein